MSIEKESCRWYDFDLMLHCEKEATRAWTSIDKSRGYWFVEYLLHLTCNEHEPNTEQPYSLLTSSVDGWCRPKHWASGNKALISIILGPDWILVPDARAILHLKSIGTVYNLVKTGRLKGKRINGNWFISRPSIDHHLRRIATQQIYRTQSLVEAERARIQEWAEKYRADAERAQFLADEHRAGHYQGKGSAMHDLLEFLKEPE